MATVEKMERLVNAAVRLCLSKRTNRMRINTLLDIAAAFEYLVIEWSDATLHIERVTDKKYRSVRQAPKEVRWSLRLAGRHDKCELVFYDLWRELGQALRELLCANYDSVQRSLRWMIETCIFWADMQLDGPSVKDMFEDYCSQKGRLTSKEFKRAFSEIYSMNEARLEERLVFKEKFRGPSLGEIAGNLAILKTTPKYKGHLLREELLKYYRAFSEYVHITLTTAKEVSLEPGTLHGDFAFFQDYRYDMDRFNAEIASMFRTVDMLIAVMILVQMEFYGYEGPIEFFESLKDVGRDFASKIEPARDAFPFTWEIVRGLKVVKPKVKSI